MIDFILTKEFIAGFFAGTLNAFLLTLAFALWISDSPPSDIHR